jgi:hypothetical protein
VWSKILHVQCSKPRGFKIFKKIINYPAIFLFFVCFKPTSPHCIEGGRRNCVLLNSNKYPINLTKKTINAVEEHRLLYSRRIVFCCCFYIQENTQFQTRQVQVGYSQVGVNSLHVYVPVPLSSPGSLSEGVNSLPLPFPAFLHTFSRNKEKAKIKSYCGPIIV